MMTEASALPQAIRGLTPDQLEELTSLAETKAWVKASQVQEFTGPEQKALRQLEKKSLEEYKQGRELLYRKYLWDSLRWFLFGGYVDLVGFQARPLKAYDPDTNPWLRLWVPGWAKTMDEHDEVNPYKLFPDKDYLRILAHAWVFSPRLAVPKSRQLMVTWLFCAIAAHTVLFRQAQRIAVISKKFDDADALLGRVGTVIEGLPSDRFYVPWDARKDRKEGLLSVRPNGSFIHAMGEEAKGLRSYTFSWVFSDEASFQDQFREINRATLATIKGGRFTLVSTSNGEEGFFEVVTEGGAIPCPPGR
jgi:hypothetical protein